MSTVQRWLTALGDAAVRSYPPLAVLAGYIAVFAGQNTEAERLAQIIETASFDGTPLDGTASFDSARSMLLALMCRAGPQRMLRDASLAVAREPSWSPWRDTALLLCGEAHLLIGDQERAAAVFAETSALAAEMCNTDSFVVSESELALLAMDRGRWVEAAGHADRALAAVEENWVQDYSMSLLPFAVAARLFVHRGALKEANRQLNRAMRVRPACTFAFPWLAVRARLQLAKVYWALAEQTPARHLIREIDDILHHRPDLGVLVDEVAAFRGIVVAGSGVAAPGASPLSPAELRLLPYLQTHLTIREIGERLFLSRNTVNTEIGSIYRKLGASSRGEAVQQATAIGLLGG
jgi:LuxR family maltose regulon positive regulatory protein